MQENPTGVLLMAYGTPETLDQVEAYFTHIRGGRTPSRESVEHLQHRYHLVGGRTPLLDITNQVRDNLQAKLDRVRELEELLGLPKSEVDSSLLVSVHCSFYMPVSQSWTTALC